MVIPMVIFHMMVLSIRRALGLFGVHYEPPALEQLPPEFDDDDEVVYRPGQVQPASPQVLEALPRSPFQSNDEGSLLCLVCQNSVEDGESVTTLPCIHRFHTCCILEWLRVRGLCPLCKLAL